MCGICGVFGASEPKNALKMLEAIVHRGPDGSKITNFPWGSFGFCRLDIVGSSNINQPAISEDGKIAVIFNGEIYNFTNLRLSIKDNRQIENEAELILKLYSIFGEDFIVKLKGMFAIAIMTPSKLILIRDALGIKPLVYFNYNDRIYFASEVKAVLQIKEAMIELDEEALAEAAVFGFVFGQEKTMFKDITQVLPGTYIIFENGAVCTKRYHQIRRSFYGAPLSEADIADQFFDKMDKAAKLFLEHSKHPHAIYLSGGIDSSLMTWFMQKNSQVPLDTFTLFDDVACDDFNFASRVAEQLATNHNEFKANTDDCIKWIDHYIYHYESLVTNGIFNILGSLAFHILAHHISKTHKIAYCGEGADELFGGYYWMHTHPLGLGDRLRSRSARINNGNTAINNYILERFPDDDSKENDVKREIFDMLMEPGLTNCHLWSVDRSSSAFSFEARPYYLYDEIREWGLSLPIENKVSDKNTKLVLKRFAQKMNMQLFIDIASRKKIGMPAALNVTLGNLLRYAEKEFREKNVKDRPHMNYSSYLETDLEKFLFDRFYYLFIERQGLSAHNYN